MESRRCKVTLQSVKHWWNNGTKLSGAELEFRALYDPTLLEDWSFSKATLTAIFTMVVDNPSALKFLQSGNGVFYVDFIKAE